MKHCTTDDACPSKYTVVYDTCVNQNARQKNNYMYHREVQRGAFITTRTLTADPAAPPLP